MIEVTCGVKTIDLPYMLQVYGVTEEMFDELVDEDTKAELIDGVMIVHSPASMEHDNSAADKIKQWEPGRGHRGVLGLRDVQTLTGRLTASLGCPDSLGLTCQLAHLLEDRIAGEQCTLHLRQPFLPNDPFLIDQEECPSSTQLVGLSEVMLHHPVRPTDLQVWMVAEQWVRQLERIGKRLLREGTGRTNPQHLHLQVLERLVIGPPGRHIRRSRHPEIVNVEFQKHQLLPPELA
jgi:hypothetical protein